MSLTKKPKTDLDYNFLKKDIQAVLDDIQKFLRKRRFEFSSEVYNRIYYTCTELLNSISVSLLPSFHSVIVYVTAVIIHELPKMKAQEIINIITQHYRIDLTSLSEEILFLHQITGMREKLELVS
ncbi:MAG: hypothetical protein ACTSQE_12840 [Candidatus Heimdallarchaeaceae archaeon]